jgi:S1-C subfamily serine protease
MGYLGNHEVQAQQTRQTQLPSPGDLSRTFINVAKQVKPAVVNVDVVEKAKASRSRRIEGLPRNCRYSFGILHAAAKGRALV